MQNNLDKKIDLHMHSVHSDGAKTPEELIAMAKERNIEYIALSDHDTASGVSEMIECGKKEGIKVFSAIELSCFDKKDTHVLGYCINPDDEAFVKKLEELKMARKNRAFEMIERLQKGGFKISVEDVVSNAEVIGRPHIANALIKNGYGKNIRDIFQKYIGYGCKYYVPYTKMSVEDGIELIKNAGGFAVLAHPKLLRYNTYDMTKLICKYKEAGLTGIETYYPCHYDSDVKFFTKVALQENLIMTVGGDYHNDNDKTKNKMGFSLELPHLNKTLEFFKDFEGRK